MDIVPGAGHEARSGPNAPAEVPVEPRAGWYNAPVMDRLAFEQLVAEAVDRLPDVFREKLDNVALVVEDWPDRRAMAAAGARHPAGLLGLYHGVPQERRTHDYGLVLPDKITVYQRPIEMRCRTPAQVRSLVEHVVRHEIAHHFGIDDARLREIGAH